MVNRRAGFRARSRLSRLLRAVCSTRLACHDYSNRHNQRNCQREHLPVPHRILLEDMNELKGLNDPRKSLDSLASEISRRDFARTISFSQCLHSRTWDHVSFVRA
jgi:hypothetical protein